jgi:hypothetical protein
MVCYGLSSLEKRNVLVKSQSTSCYLFHNLRDSRRSLVLFTNQIIEFISDELCCESELLHLSFLACLSTAEVFMVDITMHSSDPHSRINGMQLSILFLWQVFFIFISLILETFYDPLQV